MKKIFTYLKFPVIPAVLAGVFSMAASTSNAQLAANTYQFSALSGTFTEITGGTALTSIQGDDVLSASIPIGFTFNFCGTDYTQVRASSNGWVSFSSTLGTFDSYASNSSTFNNMKPCVFPLWEDIDGSSTYGGAASLYYHRYGTQQGVYPGVQKLAMELQCYNSYYFFPGEALRRVQPGAVCIPSGVRNDQY